MSCLCLSKQIKQDFMKKLKLIDLFVISELQSNTFFCSSAFDPTSVFFSFFSATFDRIAEINFNLDADDNSVSVCV